jgi:hypothetical protein
MSWFDFHGGDCKKLVAGRAGRRLKPLAVSTTKKIATARAAIVALAAVE